MHKATSLRAGVLLSVHSTKFPRGAPGGLHGRLTSRTRPACGRACVPERPVPRRPRAPTSAVGSCPGSGVRRILRITPGSGCGRREHAGRPVARARRVGFPAAAAASRGGFSVSCWVRAAAALGPQAAAAPCGAAAAPSPAWWWACLWCTWCTPAGSCTVSSTPVRARATPTVSSRIWPGGQSCR